MREKEFVSAGICVREDSTYASPWLDIPKAKGGLRDVVDMRRVNEFMQASAWPVLDVDEIRR